MLSQAEILARRWPDPVVRILTSSAELLRLKDEWPSRLADVSPGAPFRSYEWLTTWWRHFGAEDPSHELHVITVRDGAGELGGILPMYVERTAYAQRARLLGSGAVGSDYLGLLARRADELLLIAPVARLLSGELRSGNVDLYELADLDADSALATRLPDELPEAFSVRARRRWPCPILPPQADFERYLDDRPRGAGAQFRRRLRHLARQPGFELERLTTQGEIADSFDEFLALHRARWAEDGGGDGISTPALEAFHRDAARALAGRGQAVLYFLRAAGARRAALYGFVEPNRFLFYQSGHDPTWRNRSVGTVLLGLVLRDCGARGLEFDFGHGDEPYKLLWATARRHTVLLRVMPRLGIGRLIDTLELGRRLAGRTVRAGRRLVSWPSLRLRSRFAAEPHSPWPRLAPRTAITGAVSRNLRLRGPHRLGPPLPSGD